MVGRANLIHTDSEYRNLINNVCRNARLAIYPSWIYTGKVFRASLEHLPPLRRNAITTAKPSFAFERDTAGGSCCRVGGLSVPWATIGQCPTTTPTNRHKCFRKHGFDRSKWKRSSTALTNATQFFIPRFVSLPSTLVRFFRPFI